jgi:DNA-binding SARP family transcriptional activator
VRVLGQFAIDMPPREGAAANGVGGTGARVQSRALELLKALIAFGGSQVPLERVADALWPRSDSDYAQRSLTTTLHRLRKLLGDEAAIILQDGKLSLQPQMFWTDTWALEQALAECELQFQGQAAAVLKSNESEVLQAAVGRVVALYRGPMLGGDHDYLWAAAPRQQLHARILRFFGDAAPVLETGIGPAAAIRLYQRGIDIDPLAESLYRQLMGLHHRLGQQQLAIEVYERCRETLRQSLQSEPSLQTQLWFKSLTATRSTAPVD